MNTFVFPHSLLERAKQITLADLLDAPFTQPWCVSMLCNATNPSTCPPHETTEEEMLDFKISQLVRSIPPPERNAQFKISRHAIRARREARDENRTIKRK